MLERGVDNLDQVQLLSVRFVTKLPHPKGEDRNVADGTDPYQHFGAGAYLPTSCTHLLLLGSNQDTAPPGKEERRKEGQVWSCEKEGHNKTRRVPAIVRHSDEQIKQRDKRTKQTKNQTDKEPNNRQWTKQTHTEHKEKQQNSHDGNVGTNGGQVEPSKESPAVILPFLVKRSVGFVEYLCQNSQTVQSNNSVK